MDPNAAKDDGQKQADGNPKIIYLTDEARAEKTAKCPYCGEEVAINAKKCDHCSRLIEVSADSAGKVSSDGAFNFDSLGYVKSALASKYEVLDEVARTNTAVVFRAIQISLRREVALKILLRKVAQDHEYTDRFHRRARAIDKLSQSNIVSIYDEGVETGIHYMSMEFLKGIDLDRKIKEHGTLSADELISILMPAISGLGHAHRNGIVHGNIKSSSIFLHENGRIILFGFGTQLLTKGNQLSFNRDKNSLEYLSPEEASGKGADGRSDIYSLGVVMYYSLTGKFPYSATTPYGLTSSIINNQYIPINKIRQVPQWLEKIVDKCLQRDASKRVQSCGELLALLNSNPVPQSTSASQVEQPAKEIQTPVPPKEKGIDTPPTTLKSPVPPSSRQLPGFDAGELPSVEQPVKNEPPVEKPKIKPVVVEEPHVETKISQKITKPEIVKEQPKKKDVLIKPPLSPEEQSVFEPPLGESKTLKSKRHKSKGAVLLWIVVIGVVLILGGGVTLMMMSRNGNFAEPTVSTQETNHAAAEKGKEQSACRESREE